MKISGGAILCARSWSTYFEAACSAGMAKLLPKKWHDFHSTIENLEMSIGRIEKDLLIFLLAIWVKVLNFMIYPFERQFNAEIPSSFYQAIFHYFQRFLLRGEKIFVILRFWCFKNGERQKQLSGNISRRFHSIWFYSPAIHPSLPASLTMSPSKSSPSIQLLKISSKSQHVGRNCQQSPKCRIFGNCHQCQSFLKY